MALSEAKHVSGLKARTASWKSAVLDNGPEMISTAMFACHKRTPCSSDSLNPRMISETFIDRLCD